MKRKKLQSNKCFDLTREKEIPAFSVLNFKQLSIKAFPQSLHYFFNLETWLLIRKVTVLLSVKIWNCNKFFGILLPKFWLESCKSTALDHHGTQHNSKYHNLSAALTAPSPKTLIATRLQLRDWRMVKSSFSRHGQGPHIFIHAGAYKKLFAAPVTSMSKTGFLSLWIFYSMHFHRLSPKLF